MEFSFSEIFNYIFWIIVFFAYSTCGIGVVRMICEIKGRPTIALFDFLFWPLLLLAFALTGKFND